MSSIGPQLPAHLVNQSKASSDDDDDDDAGPQLPRRNIGPQIPGNLLNSGVQVDDDEEDDDGPQPQPSIGLSLPQLKKTKADKGGRRSIRPVSPPPTSSSKTKSKPAAGPSMPPPPPSTSEAKRKRTLGPSLPTYAPTYDPNAYNNDDEDDSDDDDVGPKPLPAGMQHVQPDAVKEFIEREEKRRKAAEEASKPKAPQRDEWMLVPPTSSGVLGNLDPTKLKARQFSRGGQSSSSTQSDTSLWTETPAERQQRLADEVSGRKRRVTDVPLEDEDEKTKKRRRKAEDEAIRRGVDDYTRTKRGPALVDQHTSSKKDDDDKEKKPSGIWDHSRDMGLGGRLMDDDKRSKMLKEAKGLGDRFGSGKGGGFL